MEDSNYVVFFKNYYVYNFLKKIVTIMKFYDSAFKRRTFLWNEENGTPVFARNSIEVIIAEIAIKQCTCILCSQPMGLANV